jgi:hypothetical protein
MSLDYHGNTTVLRLKITVVPRHVLGENYIRRELIFEVRDAEEGGYYTGSEVIGPTN